MPKGIPGRSIIICSDCGQERPLCAKGLCRSCYMRQWKRPIKTCRVCGGEKEHYAKGLCIVCYRARYNAYYYREHRQEILAEKGRYYRVHREKILAQKRLCHKVHRDERLVYLQKWRADNPEYMNNWYRKNPARTLARQARRRTHKRNLPNTITSDQVEGLIEIGRAIYPGEKLHLDHIVPISKGGGTTLANMHAIPARLNQAKKDALPQEAYKQIPLEV